MTVQPARFSDCLAGLEQVATAAWVMETDPVRIIWANEPALELWRASSRDELYARDMEAGAPNQVLIRMRDIYARLRAGHIVREEWAFYPRGEPLMLLLELRAMTLPDERFGVFNQAVPVPELPASVRRAATMSRHSANMTALVEMSGVILSRNPIAVEMFGEHETWMSWLVDPEQAETILRRAAAGEAVHTRAQVSARGRLQWHLITAQALRDPVSGQRGILIEHSDETARVEAEKLAESQSRHIDSLSATLELVEEQRREILALSAPILDVGDRTLAVPIIGPLDEDQSTQIMARLLDAVTIRSARRVILDLTGVATADAASVERLYHIVRALRLLGATPLLTGIRAELALSLTSVGRELEGVAIFRTLAEGLRRAEGLHGATRR